MPLTFNEGKACDAIIRLLEVREGATRTNLRFPEDERHSAPVEVAFNLGQQIFALEHTGIEPFSGFMKMSGQAGIHIDPILAGVEGRLPQDSVYELHLPAQILQGRRQREVIEIQRALVEWIVATAPSVTTRRYGDYIKNVTPSTPPGVPFQVTLYRFELMRTLPRLQIKHLLQSDTETARAERILEACNKKFPKLAAWKAEHGARSVLILEDNDIQLTNQDVVAAAYLPIAHARADRPDETYMIMTISSTWYVWPILIDAKSYYAYTDHEYPIHTEYLAADLVPLTKR